MFQTLHVSENGRFLQQQDGTPFFYLADTAWELFHKLNREEAAYYLKDRSEKGFTAIQAVALAEFDGLNVPNAYGRQPLKKNDAGVYDPALPDDDGNYSYWDHVDYIVDEAARLGMYIAFLPTWGDKYNRCWGVGPEVFTPENAGVYGRWLGKRYADRPNIIWVLGGDRTLDTRAHFEVIFNMANGIRAAVGNKHLISFHPKGGKTSGENLHHEAWLDFNMLQTGHSRYSENYKRVESEYARVPAKPVVDAEPGYELHPESFQAKNGYMDAADCRNFAYQALFSGACGHTYGNHSIWAMVEVLPLPIKRYQPGHFCMTWKPALQAEGSTQMHLAKDLLLSRQYQNMVPTPQLVVGPLEGLLHIPVLRSEKCLLAYASQGQYITLQKGFLQGKAGVQSWFDPRTGAVHQGVSLTDTEDMLFIPPTAGRGQDWVLVIDME